MIGLIAAIDDSAGMGYEGKLPWPHCAYDMELFMAMTAGDALIMGRRTAESLPGHRALRNRLNIIVSSDPQTTCQVFPGFEVGATIPHALHMAETLGKNAWIIGGASVYEWAFNHLEIDRVCLTQFAGAWGADTYFPTTAYTQFTGKTQTLKIEGLTFIWRTNDDSTVPDDSEWDQRFIDYTQTNQFLGPLFRKSRVKKVPRTLAGPIAGI